MTLPKVKSDTIESIIEEVCTKNTEFGIIALDVMLFMMSLN